MRRHASVADAERRHEKRWCRDWSRRWCLHWPRDAASFGHQPVSDHGSSMLDCSERSRMTGQLRGPQRVRMPYVERLADVLSDRD